MATSDQSARAENIGDLMVQPKNKKTITEQFREISERFERDHPVLAERWYVVEVTPPYRWHDGYDWTWTGQEVRVVSPYFDTLSAAEEWLDDHEPDNGKTLETRHQKLREYRYTKWS